MGRKISEVNILRTLACIMVILVHTTANPATKLPEGSTGLIVFSVINRMAKPSVPIFIFLSGLTLFNKYRYEDFKFFGFLKRRLSTILVPYVLWTVLYYLVYIKTGYYTFSIGFLLKGLLLGNMVYHLYFIVIILQFYLLFGVFLYIFKRYNPHLAMAAMLALNVLAVFFVRFAYTDRFFTTYIVYFALGCYVSVDIGRFKELLKKYRYAVSALFIILSVYYCRQFYAYNTLKMPVNGKVAGLTFMAYSLVSTLFLYYMSAAADKGAGIFKGLLNRISDASFYIYLSHPLALMVSAYILNRLMIRSVTARFFADMTVVLLAVFPLSFLYVYFKTNYFSKILPGTRTSKSM